MRLLNISHVYLTRVVSMNQILLLNDMDYIYRGLCYLGFDIDDSYIDELIEECKDK